MAEGFNNVNVTEEIDAMSINETQNSDSESSSHTVLVENIQPTTTNKETDVMEAIKSTILHEYARNGRKPICYFSLVTDPHDFGTTVDNILHVSDLLNQDFLELFKGEHGLLYVRPLIEEEKYSTELKEKEPTQGILSIDMDNWVQIIEAYQIKNPMINIPNRYETRDPSTDKDST